VLYPSLRLSGPFHRAFTHSLQHRLGSNLNLANHVVEAWNLIQPEYEEVAAVESLREYREHILRIASKYGASNVRIFGSVARGTAGPDSDVDLLVDFEPGRSLLDHAGLVIELEALLARKVEVGTTKGLRSPYRERILQEAVAL